MRMGAFDRRLEFYDSEPNSQRLKGEWFFRRVLEGAAIEDIFIRPSREAKELDLQPDGEYGAAIRMYDQSKRRYDMTYDCTKYAKRLEVRKEQGAIIYIVPDDPAEKHVFSDMTKSTFHWQNIRVLENGIWRVNREVFASRVG